MQIFDLYSKRKKREKGDIPDVYSYDNFPPSLRVQVVHIWNDLIGNMHDYLTNNKVENTYKCIVEALRREYGVFILGHARQGNRNNYKEELQDYFLNEPDVDRCIDVIELSIRVANNICRQPHYRRINNADEYVDGLIKELNFRLKEHGVGYEFINNEIVRIDSQLLHNQVVKPALKLLNVKGYEGVQDEFMLAFEHFRHSNYKEALNDALKSFESMMKTICAKNSWVFDSRDTAKKLINKCVKNGLFPEYYQNHLNALIILLESGVPTIRNKESGHGQGEEVTAVDSGIVAYTLHMTASAIVMLGAMDDKLSV